MLDWRAFLVSVLLVAFAAGSYLVWSDRARFIHADRSLTAPPPSANPATKPKTHSLHVDGCKEDFIVKVGELVEPRVVPGASLAQFRSIYGKETKQDQHNVATWERRPYTLTESDSEPGQTSFVHLTVPPGHVVETLDGVELGIDSFAAILHKMRDRKIEVEEKVAASDGKWTLTFTLASGCARQFISEYSRSLDSGPEIDKQIAGKIEPGGQPGPLRPDVFLNKVVYDYSLKPSSAAGH
jgi:hypothetical protein